MNSYNFWDFKCVKSYTMICFIFKNWALNKFDVYLTQVSTDAIATTNKQTLNISLWKFCYLKKHLEQLLH